ncbi:MAG: hypothetical protein NC311_02350 [Muribaculaceae bacterium]|nr:hypothetical protein [Muribaculaceae bacterium]
MSSNKDKMPDINQRLKWELYGRIIACGGIAVVMIIVNALQNKADRDSANVERQISEFMARQPNWADSLRTYDAKNADDIEHLQNMVTFLDVNPMPNVNVDSLHRELDARRAGRQQLVDAGVRSDARKQQYLDSVRRANKYNVFVRNAAMQYSK